MASLEYLQNGRYAVLKKLGEGGKGVVYKARDTMLNRVVAIKMLKSAVTEGEAYSRFLTEAQAVAKLNHPNIVSIYDIGKEDSKQFFVLEFVDGENLRDLMKAYPEGKCDIQVVLRIGMDVCSALQYAHSHGVLHRDIKPENVMITKEEIAKLMDFGLARILGQPGITHEGIIVGTVAYVAPENALGRGADARSDLYSFGAMLYEALTGRSPFPGEDPVKVIFGHVHDYPVPVARLNSKVPSALADCVMRLLEKDPERRYQTATDLLKALKEIARQLSDEISIKPTVAVPAYRPTVTGEAALVDRVGEMSTIRDAIDRAVRREGGLILVRGEAGIGKTRLTREASAYAHLRGMKVLNGRYPALFTTDDIPPYVLWSEVIKEFVATSTPEQLSKVIGLYPAEVCKLAPEITQKLITIPQSPLISPENEQRRLFEAVSQLVTNISRDVPLLLILDDLQWADRSSLLLLHYLARGTQNEALLILGAYRDSDVGERHPLSPVLMELNRERLVQTIALKRMSPDEIRDMIRQILERDDVPREFCQLVYEKTKGNPFFVEEVIKSLKEELIIYREENRWKTKNISDIELPNTVKSVVKSRLERMDDECQDILVAASVIGERFSFEALCEVAGIDESKLSAIMEKILKTGLVKEKVVLEEDAYAFTDVMVRDVLYGESSHLRRKRLHISVGSALERVYGNKIEQHFGELAYHFLEGGEKDKALGYFLKAGERATKIYANNEAEFYLESALRLLEEKEGKLQEKGRVLERLGEIKKLIGEYDACMKYWNQALLLSKQSGEEETVARLYRKTANVLTNQGDTEKAKVHYEMALRILEIEPESVELASLFDDMTRFCLRTEDVPKASSWAEKTLNLAQKLNANEIVASSYTNFADALSLAKDKKKAVEYYEKALKIALDNSYLETAIRAYSSLSTIFPSLETLGALVNEERFKLLEKAYELAKKLGDTHWVSFIGTALADAHWGMGNMSKAVALAEESVALARKAGDIADLSYALAELGGVCAKPGEWEKCENHCKEALSLAQKSKDMQGILTSFFIFGTSYMLIEEYEKSATHLEKAVELAVKSGAKSLEYWSRCHLAIPCIALGELEKAENLLESVLKYASEAKDIPLMAVADCSMGMLRHTQKKLDESIAFFEKSLQEYLAFGGDRFVVYWYARLVLYEYACVYLERDQPGDREKADKLLNQALELFQRMDVKKGIERVIAKKKLLTA